MLFSFFSFCDEISHFLFYHHSKHTYLLSCHSVVFLFCSSLSRSSDSWLDLSVHSGALMEWGRSFQEAGFWSSHGQTVFGRSERSKGFPCEIRSRLITKVVTSLLFFVTQEFWLLLFWIQGEWDVYLRSADAWIPHPFPPNMASPCSWPYVLSSARCQLLPPKLALNSIRRSPWKLSRTPGERI